MEETEHGRRLAVAGRHGTSHRERRRAMAATLFMDVDGAWRATLVIVYTVSGIAGIVLIGRAFATSKRVPDTDEAASGISERESK